MVTESKDYEQPSNKDSSGFVVSFVAGRELKVGKDAAIINSNYTHPTDAHRAFDIKTDIDHRSDTPYRLTVRRNEFLPPTTKNPHDPNSKLSKFMRRERGQQ